jgi:hypothetical protein
VQRDVARGAQQRLPQPLQPECKQQEPDDDPQGLDRKQRERGPEQRHHQRERAQRGGDADPHRVPAPGIRRCQHDRQRLDHLDGRREERRRNENRAAHTASMVGFAIVERLRRSRLATPR